MADIQLQIDDHDRVVVTTTTAKPSFRICIGPMLPYQEVVQVPTEVRMSSEMKALVAIAPVTLGGQPAPLDGPAIFTMNGACPVDQVADNQCWVYGSGAGADSVLTIKGDADLGEGVVTIMDTVVFHIEHPQAAALGTTVGEPVLKEPGDPA